MTGALRPASPRPLPLVIGPAGIGARHATKAGLIDWIRHERAGWQDPLHTHGAVLFRGFAGLTTAEDFEAVTWAVSPDLIDYVGGMAPRIPVSGKIATSTEAPARQTIPQHQEMSYTSPFPDKVMFFCEVAADVGGQTPLADMRHVTAKLPAALVAEFEGRGLRLVRELPNEARRVGDKVWQEVFHTTDRAEVDRIAAARGWDVEWLAGAKLRLTQERRPAMITHPHTGDRLWFNAAHLFWRSPLRKIGRRLTGMLHDRGKSDYVFGDGAAIPSASLLAIHRAFRGEMRTFDWQAGDVLLIDNLLVSHGRRPYQGSRRILAALIRDAA